MWYVDNHRIQKLTVEGKFLLQYSDMGTADGQLEYILGITVHNKRVYVADQCDHCISVLWCDGNFCQTIGKSGELNYPFDVVVNNNIHLLVANLYGNWISLFAIDGTYINRINTQGSSNGHLSGPCSLTIDI